MPGARALRPGSSASSLPTAPGGPGARASRGTRLQLRAGGRGCPREVRTPSGLALADPPRSPGPEGPGGNVRIRPRSRDSAAGPALRGGARPSSGPRRGPRGWGGRGAPGRRRDVPSFGLPSARSGPAGPARVAAPAPRAPAPSLGPRAFLGRHLFATCSLRNFSKKNGNPTPHYTGKSTGFVTLDGTSTPPLTGCTTLGESL